MMVALVSTRDPVKHMVQLAKKPTRNFPKHLKDSQNVRNKVLYSDETKNGTF